MLSTNYRPQNSGSIQRGKVKEKAGGGSVLATIQSPMELEETLSYESFKNKVSLDIAVENVPWGTGLYWRGNEQDELIPYVSSISGFWGPSPQGTLQVGLSPCPNASKSVNKHQDKARITLSQISTFAKVSQETRPDLKSQNGFENTWWRVNEKTSLLWSDGGSKLKSPIWHCACLGLGFYFNVSLETRPSCEAWSWRQSTMVSVYIQKFELRRYLVRKHWQVASSYSKKSSGYC